MEKVSKTYKKLVKKQRFKREIENLVTSVDEREKDFDYMLFQNKFKSFLNENNCNFGFQNRNSKKHGHIKEKRNIKTGEVILEIKIERNDNIAGQMYTMIHELVHFLNNHLHSKKLTSKQKEVVADTVGIMVIKYLKLNSIFYKSNLAKKWDVKNYANEYINSMTFSKTKEEEIIRQIKNSYSFIIDYFFE